MEKTLEFDQTQEAPIDRERAMDVLVAQGIDFNPNVFLPSSTDDELVNYFLDIVNLDDYGLGLEDLL